MTTQNIAYFNGDYLLLNQIHVSPLDRGALFGHAAYEVTAVYDGRLIDFDGHVSRLGRTLEALDIPNPHSPEQWRDIHQTLVAKNDLREGLIYLHVTAGAYDERDFSGPKDLIPNVFATVTPKPLIGEAARRGIAAITRPDTRWARRDLKTTQLLSQALAYRAARDAGAVTAIMHEDGYVTEAASANVWIVDAKDRLITRDLSHALLAGITRQRVKTELEAAKIAVVETRFSLDTLRGAKEIFTTSAGALIAPIVTLDSQPIGSGEPGPMTRQVQTLYYRAMGASDVNL